MVVHESPENRIGPESFWFDANLICIKFQVTCFGVTIESSERLQFSLEMLFYLDNLCYLFSYF